MSTQFLELRSGRTSSVTGPERVTLTVSWYCPSPMRMVVFPSLGLEHCKSILDVHTSERVYQGLQ